MSVATIHAAIKTTLDTVEGLTVGTVRHQIPTPLPSCVVLFLGDVNQQNVSTGGLTDNVWRYTVDFYFDARDRDAAETALMTKLPAALTALRGAATLSGTCDFHTVDGSEEAEYTPGENEKPTLRKRIYVDARTEETT